MHGTPKTSSKTQLTWSIGMFALTGGALLGFGISPSAPMQPSASSGRGRADSHNHGNTADFRTTLDLLPSSTRSEAMLQLSIDNKTSDSLKVAHVVQLIDSKKVDVMTPATRDPDSADANSIGKPAPFGIDLSAVKDGYYEILVQSLASPSKSPDPPTRGTSSHVYVAVDADGVRIVDFYEWYTHSGADQLTITDHRIGPPIKDMKEYAAKLAKGEL